MKLDSIEKGYKIISGKIRFLNKETMRQAEMGNKVCNNEIGKIVRDNNPKIIWNKFLIIR